MIDERVDQVRAFNRFYTGVIGLLRSGLLDSPYSLTEVRVMFDLAQQAATDVPELRRALDLDAGYLSRILARFEADGLIIRSRSASDARRQTIELTANGRAVFADLDARSGAQVRALLAGLSEEDQRRLVSAMSVIRQTLSGSTSRQPYLLRPLRPGDYGWVVHRHGVRYAEEYGWDASFEALVARIVADYVDDHDGGDAWIAEVDGESVGCVLCVASGVPGTAQLRLLLVEQSARGMGIGARLVEECLRFARRSGYKRIMLWTNDVLADARRVYERAGFSLDSWGHHHSFGKDLVEQVWSRDL